MSSIFDAPEIRVHASSSTITPVGFASSPGLIAGYAFDESSGTTATDSSGNNLNGTLTNGATRAAGKYGTAASLDGINDFINLGNPTQLQITGSMTISAWINSATFPGDDAAVVSKRGLTGYQLDTTVDRGFRGIGFKLTNSSGGSVYRYGASTLQTNTWYHIAGVYNASTQTMNVYLNGVLDNGVLSGTVTSSQTNSQVNVNIGRRSGSTGYEFPGRIDDVRIYSRALTQVEIQSDMNSPIGSAGGPDTTPPTVPTGLIATPVSTTRIDLQWTASSDNVGVTGYRVFRNGSQVGTPTVTSFSDIGLSAGTQYAYTVSAVDAAGNQSAQSAPPVNATTPAPDTTLPVVSITAPVDGSNVSGNVVVSANASDNVGVVGVQFQIDGANLGSEDTTSPYSISWSSSSVSNGSHTIGAVARDAAGNTKGASIGVVVSNTQTPGLTAGYAFDEPSGTTAVDASGHGINGTLTNGATRSAGKNGTAVTLDGANNFVDLANPTSLQITGSITISAWVNASVFPADDAAVVSKRASNPLGFQLDLSRDNGPRTIGFKLTNSSNGAMFRYGGTALQTNTWYHVTGVYDAAAQTMHVYLNGQLDDGILQGTITASQQNSPANVNIGRRPGAASYEFNGRIDDVRIYNRALSASEIQFDMLTPVGSAGGGDTTPPSVQIDQPTNGATVSDIVVVSAQASDNVALAGVQFFVDGIQTGSLDTTAPFGLAWDSRTASNGAHALTARAYDTSGNSTLSATVTVNVSNVNYFRNEILATGLNLPTVIKFLPDGRMLVVEFPGAIKVLPPPYIQPAPTPFLQLTDVPPPGGFVDRGIMDMALDPNFSTNHFYYIFYTAGSTTSHDRLSRFTANASLTGTIAGSELVLYQDPRETTADSQSHHGGAITFGADGKIYFTTGDHFQGAPSQDLTNPRGKLLRINPDGTVPTDNPFYDGAGPNYDAIWALGLRNPYRAFFDAPTGRLLIGDVGGNDPANSQEEVNVAARGANYGWPNVEGVSSNPAYKNPLYAYSHAGRDASITGGFVYHGSQFPSGYQGSYFFADYTQNWIRRLTLDANGNVTGVFNFEPTDGSVDGPYGDIVYLTEGPDGSLYYLDIGYSDVGGTYGVSKIRRIQYIQSNLPPVVAATANPQSGPAPLTVNFSSAGSSDPEGQPLSFQWNFGDGQTSTAASPQHTYANAGSYQARLSISDGVNSTLSTPIAISVGSRPVVTLTTTPANGALFRAGDLISYSAQATDTEDGTLPASGYTWNVDFLHDGHVHPGIPINGVTSGSFTIPITGHDFSGFTRYRITVTVTDSTGLQASQSSTVFPDKVNLTFNTVPTGLTLYVDEIAHTAPFVYDTLIGFHHTIEARNQTVSTTNYTFASWSDGGAQQHAVTVPATAQTYTATYNVSAPPPPSGLTAGYAFDENTGANAADSSGHNINGTLTNGPTWAIGRNGSALNFDGLNDFVNLGNPALLQITGSMTISAWINSSSFPGDDAAVVSKRGSNGYQLDTTIDRGFRGIGFKLTNGSGSSVYRYGATTIQANTWYHIAGVYDASSQTMHVYLNGVLDDGALVGTITASQVNSALNVNIGKRAGNPGYEFVGRIDDVRIYGRALSLTEIQTDMNTPLGAGGPGDITPPTVSITSPAGGAQVSDIITVTADASDNIGVVGVQFLVDGVSISTEDTDAPYGVNWDTRGISNGAHSLTAQARDAAGNVKLSAAVSVNVANTNFFQNEVLTTGLSLPTAVKFLPDGRMLVVELAGTIRVVPPPYTTPNPTPFLQLTNVGSAGVQQGIYEITLDPNFAANHFYYIFYTAGSPNHDRLSRFTANATLTGTIAGSELILYEDPQNANAEHHGGAINFGNDGKIYFTTGEHFNAADAQLLSSPRGKLHRINPDGTVPTDNPFYDGAGPLWDSIWAVGLRNPFRAYFDAVTNKLYIGDVGGNIYSTAMEEVNIGARGANYGWPNCEQGTCGNQNYTAALYAYPHLGRDASITGGFIYRGTQYPSSFQGSYFFADYTQNWIRRLTFDAQGNVNGVFNFEPADGSVDGPYGDIVYLTEGPDGALYYVDLGYSDIGGQFGVSKIRRIRYVQSNLPPTAISTANPLQGPAPLQVTFSSVGSSDPEGQSITYLWTFGDGSTSTSANPVHAYNQPGQYTARLSVSDGVNTTLGSPITISAGTPPTATITSPANGALFIAGDVISYAGNGSDSQGNVLPASAFSWSLDFLHEGHVHPGIPVNGVKSGSFTIPNTGHDFTGFTRYRITLTVTDSAGLQSSASVTILPNKINLTFQSVPSGLTLFVDGIAKTTPFVLDTLTNFQHTIEARNQTSGGTNYTFSSWSDGGPQIHTLTVPNSAQTYVATFSASQAQPINIGETTILGSTDSGNANLLLAQDAVLSQAATIQSLSFYVLNPNGQLRLGIYDSTGPGGGPGALRAQTNAFTPVAGWNTSNVVTPVLLPAGTYWLAYLPSSSSLSFAANFSIGNHKLANFTFGPMPATFPIVTQQGPTHWSLYGTLTP